MSLIETILLGIAGFLAATLIALFTLPYLTGRAARKAVRTLRENVPFSAAEMIAEKDQLRAEHAVSLRKIEIELTKNAERVSAQNIVIRELEDKLSATNKIGKAGKLALEEMRSKEHELNERLRLRDAQYAGLEQRTRQMLRENRDLKNARRNQKEEAAGKETINASYDQDEMDRSVPSVSDTPVVATGPASTAEELKIKLESERVEHSLAKKKIVELQQELMRTRDAASPDKKVDNGPRLPRAILPTSFGGADEPKQNAEQSKPDDLSTLQNQVLDLAAELATITTLLEGAQSPAHGLLAAIERKADDSLAARMKKLIAQARNKIAEGAGKEAHPAPIKSEQKPAPEPELKEETNKVEKTTRLKNTTVTTKPAQKKTTNKATATRVAQSRPTTQAKPNVPTKPRTAPAKAATVAKPEPAEIKKETAKFITSRRPRPPKKTNPLPKAEGLIVPKEPAKPRAAPTSKVVTKEKV